MTFLTYLIISITTIVIGVILTFVIYRETILISSMRRTYKNDLDIIEQYDYVDIDKYAELLSLIYIDSLKNIDIDNFNKRVSKLIDEINTLHTIYVEGVDMIMAHTERLYRFGFPVYDDIVNFLESRYIDILNSLSYDDKIRRANKILKNSIMCDEYNIAILTIAATNKDINVSYTDNPEYDNVTIITVPDTTDLDKNTIHVLNKIKSIFNNQNIICDFKLKEYEIIIKNYETNTTLNNVKE